MRPILASFVPAITKHYTSYQLLEIEISGRVRVIQVDDTSLPGTWREREDMTRGIGDAWLREETSTVLAVPSAITPYAVNYLINPRHRQVSQLRLVSVAKHPFDVRLLKIISRS